MNDPIILVRIDGRPHVNIPRTVIQHSPDGFEWGYGGSGPADLALNILQQALIRQGFEGPQVRCFSKTWCYRRAWELHQDFKWAFITPMPRDGGQITWEAVADWIAQQDAAEEIEALAIETAASR